MTSPENLNLGTTPSQQNVTTKQALPSNTSKTMLCNPNPSTFLSKPRLVGMLEDYLERELKLIGSEEISPNPARLQAHREVFEHLIGEFSSFKPLMSAIKQEYDSYISDLEGKVEFNDPLKMKIQLLEEENERNLLASQNTENQVISRLKEVNKGLESTIHTLREASKDSTAQVKKLKSELSSQYMLYRNEVDAKKIVISDLNELKKSQQQPEDQVKDKEDPIVLRMALKQARQDLKQNQRKLTQIVADYGDVVPRKEFDDLSSQFETQKESYEQLVQDFTGLKLDFDVLTDSNRQSLLEKAAILSDLDRIKGNATPRPQWNRCARFFEDDKWAEWTENASSSEKVDVLLAQISGLSLEEIRAGDKFQGLGLDDNIPKFLRCEGEIQNTHMNKQNAYKIMSGYWPYRVQQLVNNEKVSLDVSLFSYLSEDQSEESAFENAYNIQNVLTQNEFQLLPALLLHILQGKADEELYFELLARHDILKSQLGDLSKTEECEISKQDLVTCLTSNFQIMTEEMAVNLTNGIAGSDAIPAEDIMKQIGEGKSNFVEKFYEFFLEMREELLKEFAVKFENFEKVSVDEFVSVLKELDPPYPDKKLAQLLRYVFKVSDKQQESLPGDATENVPIVLSRLRQSSFLPTSK